MRVQPVEALPLVHIAHVSFIVGKLPSVFSLSLDSLPDGLKVVEINGVFLY
jgi:hypothetical protein